MAERALIQDVNIELGDNVSEMLYNASQETHANRPGYLIEFHKSFSGARATPIEYYRGIPGLLLGSGMDGVGTKVEVAERTGDHSTVAFDLLAMVADDAAVRGAEPLEVATILDVRQLNDTEEVRLAMEGLAHGYVQAANAANVVVTTGETAELGYRINGYRQPITKREWIKSHLFRQAIDDKDLNYNWGASVRWVAHKDRILTGHKIEPGQKLVGLVEPGFRSNGITDVRKAMQERYGKQWHNKVVPELGSVSLGELVQVPSTIYTRLITRLNGGYDPRIDPTAEITGVAHITGGGQPSKLGRMLEPSGYGAIITDPIEPPKIMKHVQEIRGFDDETAYKKWHMGPGMVIATPDPDTVVAQALAMGFRPQVIGEITRKPGIHISNRGARADDDRSGKTLSFLPKAD